MNDNEYLKDLSDQIRSEIREFYTINAAFLIANSFLINVNLAVNFKFPNQWWLIVFIIINSIWFFALLLANEWIKYWMDKAKNDAEELKVKKYIWSKNDEITILKIPLRKLFYSLPFLFSSLFLAIGYFQYNDLIKTLILFATLIIIFVLGFLGICKTKA
jgi:hypothetical protein